MRKINRFRIHFTRCFTSDAPDLHASSSRSFHSNLTQCLSVGRAQGCRCSGLSCRDLWSTFCLRSQEFADFRCSLAWESLSLGAALWSDASNSLTRSFAGSFPKSWLDLLRLRTSVGLYPRAARRSASSGRGGEASTPEQASQTSRSGFAGRF